MSLDFFLLNDKKAKKSYLVFKNDSFEIKIPTGHTYITNDSVPSYAFRIMVMIDSIIANNAGQFNISVDPYNPSEKKNPYSIYCFEGALNDSKILLKFFKLNFEWKKPEGFFSKIKSFFKDEPKLISKENVGEIELLKSEFKDSLKKGIHLKTNE